MNEEIKVVISLKGNQGFVGVQSPNCDPVFELMDGELQVFLDRAPGLVQEAKEKWAENPLNPKCESPLPSQAKPPSPPAGSTPRQTQSTLQPRMI